MVISGLFRHILLALNPAIPLARMVKALTGPTQLPAKWWRGICGISLIVAPGTPPLYLSPMNRCFLLLAVLALCYCQIGRSIAQQTTTDIVEDGIAKNRAGDFMGALKAFSIAITMNPDRAENYVNRGLEKPTSMTTGEPYSTTTRPLT